jgi:zinc transport system ATP-binding protein
MEPEPPFEPEFHLPAPLTLRLYVEGKIIFSSEKHWLHPLFDLETLFAQGCDPSKTLLVDRITGRAAAFLVAHLGIRRLRTQVLSRLAIPVLERHNIEYRCVQTIARVACATEALLSEIQDQETAYAWLRDRWEQAKPHA